MSLSIDELDNCPAERFVELLGGIYEHSPWVPARVADARPFGSRSALESALAAAMRAAPEAQRLDLLCQHPELAGRQAQADQLTDDSKREQRDAGLDQCSALELERIQHNNAAYRERFGFPFIIAVTGLDRGQIIDAMQRRLGNAPGEEFETALDEVEKIAAIRLAALIDD